MDELWFRAKRYGYGWYPANYKGWLVILAYVILFILSSILFVNKDYIHVHIIVVILLTSALLVISYKKGEELRWRWGE